MSEREDTAAEFAAMLAGASPSSPDDVSASPAEPALEPESSKREANAAFAAALFGPKPATAALAAALGLERAGEPEPQEPDAPPDFDGGAREPAPGPSDPEADHNQTVLALFQRTPAGQGGDW